MSRTSAESISQLYLPPLAIQRVRDTSGAAWPHEGCGLLEGEATATAVQVARVLICVNVHDQPTHRYTIDPEEFLHAEHAAQQYGRGIVGVWHSHPNGEPVPSATDRAEAWPGWSYLIAGVTNGTLTALRCWHLDDGVFREQAIVTTPAPAARGQNPDSETSDERT